ncbi:MAG: hypothetical protein WBA74_21885, partial [Cyclobacteriaceae bacterium]
TDRSVSTASTFVKILRKGLMDYKRLLLYCLIVLTISWSLGCSSGISQTGMPVKINGVNFVSTRSAIDSADVIPIVNIKGNFLAAIPYGFINGNRSTVYYDTDRQWYGETVAGTVNIVQEAQKQGLQVMIKPHIWVGGQGWAGDFELSGEENWREWERQFDAYILTYAKLADSLDVEIFCMATEFRKVVQKRPQYWQKLITKIRKVYSGQLTYAANWDNYQEVTFWDQLDFIGIDAYFPLVHEPTPSVDQLKKEWQTIHSELRSLSEKHGKKILFTEYGYQSVDLGAGKHWEIDLRSGPVNEEVQANAYEALYEVFWAEKWFAGGFLWKWYPNHQRAGGPDNKRFTPQNKLAEEVITTYYGKN